MDEKPDKRVDIRPLKYAPPIEAARRIIDADRARPYKNKVLRWIKIFFSEGF